MVFLRSRHDVSKPEVAMSLFRYWCHAKGMIPEYATIEELHRFGNYLLSEGYTQDEVRGCEYIIFNRL